MNSWDMDKKYIYILTVHSLGAEKHGYVENRTDSYSSASTNYVTPSLCLDEDRVLNELAPL